MAPPPDARAAPAPVREQPRADTAGAASVAQPAPQAAAPRAARRAAVAAAAVPAVTATQEDTAASAESAEPCPAELQSLEPAYASMLMNNPKIKEFLLKHPHVMKNLNADNVKFLIRNVMRSCRNAKQKHGDSVHEAGSAAGRALTISNLPLDATESDIALLFARAGLGHVEVSLARESRYRRSCGIAFAILDSREAAEEAIAELQDAFVHGHRITVECAGGGDGGEGSGGGRRIAWKEDDELWEVALYDRFESVLEFRGRVQESAAGATPNLPPLAAVLPPESARAFKEAASRERVEESRRVREALGSEPA